MFEPFVQAHGGYTRESGGTGLGLTIARRLARLIDGDLSVRSCLGKGSCFSLWLPVTQEPANARTCSRSPNLTRSCGCWSRASATWATRSPATWTTSYAVCARASPTDPLTTAARKLDRAKLEDHTATFLVAIGNSLVVLDQGGGEPRLMRDGTEIQRLIPDLHGAQRARIGLDERALRREFALLRQIVEETLRTELPETADAAVERPSARLNGLLEQAERLSLRGWHKARSDAMGRRL
jgi:hypothetical protein